MNTNVEVGNARSGNVAGRDITQTIIYHSCQPPLKEPTQKIENVQTRGLFL